jgi:hypothetical protein
MEQMGETLFKACHKKNRQLKVGHIVFSVWAGVFGATCSNSKGASLSFFFIAIVFALYCRLK